MRTEVTIWSVVIQEAVAVLEQIGLTGGIKQGIARQLSVLDNSYSGYLESAVSGATEGDAIAMQPPVQVVVGVSGYRVESGGYGVTGERFVRVDLPPTVTEEHIALMQKDFAIMAEIAQQHPKDLTALQNAMIRHDFNTATRLAGKIGLTEEQLAARGGGQIGVAVGILVVLAATAVILDALSGSGDAAPSTATPAQPTVGLDGGLPPGGTP